MTFFFPRKALSQKRAVFGPQEDSGSAKPRVEGGRFPELIAMAQSFSCFLLGGLPFWGWSFKGKPKGSYTLFLWSAYICISIYIYIHINIYPSPCKIVLVKWFVPGTPNGHTHLEPQMHLLTKKNSLSRLRMGSVLASITAHWSRGDAA